MAPNILIIQIDAFGKKRNIRAMTMAAETAPENDIICIGDRKLPKNNAARQVLKTATKIPVVPLIRIIVYSVITFAKPTLSQGKILGRGDSRICNAAAQATRIAIKVICLICFLLLLESSDANWFMLF